VTFQVGDKVIYPNHGLGVVERIEEKTILGTTCGFYHLHIVANDTTVLVPLTNADSVGLRRAIGDEEVERLFGELGNGKIDKWEYYDEHNKIERVGSSSRDDEVQDTFAYPDAGGFLARVETDSDRDGAIDKREFFVPRPGNANERVVSVMEYEFDTTGQPGRRLYYRPDGSFDRSEKLRP